MANILTLDEALAYGIKFAQKQGADQVEAFSSNSKGVEVSIEKNIPKITNGISSGISFRVASNNNLGFAFTKTLSKQRIEDTIKVGIQNAKSKGKDPHFTSLPSPSKAPNIDIQFDKKLNDITSDFLADKLSEMIKDINESKDLSFLQCQGFLQIQDDHLVNSNGIDIKSRSGGIGGISAAITTKGLIPNYSYSIKGGPTSDLFNFNELTQDTINQTLRAAGPKTINFQKEVPIILEPEASFGLMGGLFSLLLNQLSGDNIASGSTPYSDQIGNEIAIENFTLIDNGLNPDKINRGRFDAEGIPREKTILVDKGILQTFLLDNYFGNKLGLKSNGKSVRSGVLGFGDPIKSIPSIGFTIPELLPGDATKDEMIAETKEGFMIRSLMGLHMSDQSSGRFSVTGFGWYIKNGEIKYPVQDLSISGVLPKLLKEIDMISKEREDSLLSVAPYIRFSSIPVTAKKFDFKTRMALSIVKILTSLKIMKHPMIA
ncbi:MAG: TldD/PmbA family protein [Asgard group archaeon]|nr:TldD/PmbA family protein [Asgard group archaeon]